MLHDMDKVLIKKVAETKINAPFYHTLMVKTMQHDSVN